VLSRRDVRKGRTENGEGEKLSKDAVSDEV
jgi:hypothetical protein